MSDAPKSGLTRGEIIVAPNNPGAYIMRPFREKVCAILTAFLKQRIIAIVTPADGSVPIQVEAEIYMASNGMVATLDLTAVAGLGGGTGGGTRYYNGAGAPSATTLPAGNYISTASMVSPAGPDFYFDLTNAASPDYWVCVTAGTETTSVWLNLTGCS
jgi:hypothetical protein